MNPLPRCSCWAPAECGPYHVTILAPRTDRSDENLPPEEAERLRIVRVRCGWCGRPLGDYLP